MHKQVLQIEKKKIFTILLLGCILLLSAASFLLVEGAEPAGNQKGSITVVKEANPEGRQKFKFRGDLGNFKLIDWDAGVTNEITFDGLDPGTYAITEVVPKFWMLMSIDIDDDDSYVDETKATATVILGEGEHVTVTFNNEMIPAPHEIVFLGATVNPDLTVTFCYRVTSGVPAISHWELWSSLFKEGALVSVSEKPYEYKPEEQMLKFDKGYKDYETRVVCFTLDTGLYYSGYQIVPIPYSIKAAGSVYNGYVDGPESPQIKMLIPGGPLGSIGAIVPMLAALGLVVLSKRNVITITVD